MADLRQKLLTALDKLVEGKLNPDQFRDEIYWPYLDEDIESELTEREGDLFGALQQKFEYTSTGDISDEERRDGVISYREFIDFARCELENFKLGKPAWPYRDNDDKLNSEYIPNGSQ